MTNKIDLETASKILINNPPDNVYLTIVGGNALDFWVEVYSETFDFVQPFLEMKTRDVDFVIKENAITCINTIGFSVIDGNPVCI